MSEDNTEGNRLECLRMATLTFRDAGAEDILTAARAFYDFVAGTEVRKGAAAPQR
jgi:hypothetical protein